MREKANPKVEYEQKYMSLTVMIIILSAQKSEVMQVTFGYSFLPVHPYLGVAKGQKELKRSTSAAEFT